MRKFKFRLESVLEFRKRKEDQRKKELGLLKQFLQKEQLFLKELEVKMIESQNKMQAQQHGTLNMESIMNYYYYLTNVKEKILNQIALIEELIARIEQKREDLITASKERKIMEKLKDNQYKEFRDMLEKWEAKAIDEMATNLYTHKTTKSHANI